MANVKDSKLTAFFKLCESDAFAKTLVYLDVPRYFTWNTAHRR